MSQPETQSAIQADLAWARLVRALGKEVPGHLHRAQTGWRKIAQIRRKG